VGFSVEISLLAAGEFFRASAVPDLEAVLEAQKKSALVPVQMWALVPPFPRAEKMSKKINEND
jgi:hypothetical protein